MHAHGFASYSFTIQRKSCSLTTASLLRGQLNLKFQTSQAASTAGRLPQSSRPCWRRQRCGGPGQARKGKASHYLPSPRVGAKEGGREGEADPLVSPPSPAATAVPRRPVFTAPPPPSIDSAAADATASQSPSSPLPPRNGVHRAQNVDYTHSFRVTYTCRGN